MTLDMQHSGTRGCSRCENLPDKTTELRQLYLWLPLEHSTSKLIRKFRCDGWTHEVRDDFIVVELDRGLEELLIYLSETLSSTEIEDTQCLLKNDSEKLSVQHIPRARTLTHLYAVSRSQWLSQMIEEARLTAHFQPIVYADRPAEVFGYESLLRGVDVEDNLVSPGEIFSAAKVADLLFQTDLAARRTAIDEAVSHGIEARIFVNFTPTAIYDPEFCLRSTVEQIDRAGVAHEKVVFEITESESLNDTRHLLNIVDFYKATGFKVALDDMGSGYSSLNLMHQLKPDFVKLDMQLIKGVNTDHYKATVTQKLLEMAQDLGTKTIVEGIETEQELAWAQDHGADFAQGYLIARPASPPPLPVF